MSIGLIQFDQFRFVDQSSAGDAKPPASQSPPGPSLGMGPKTEAAATHSVADAGSTPTEEVKVQSDPLTGEQVYQFIDRKSGSLILQIPTEQMLNFIRDVQQQWDKLISTSVDKPAAEEKRK